jgi:class 3 adenylate cyclase/HAMP domain-containing protein
MALCHRSVGGGVASVDKSKQQTIRTKFLRVTIPLIFLTVIGVFSAVELMTHKNAIDQLHETLAGMIATQSAALATPVWNLDREQIQLSLEAVVTNREIVAVRIYGEDGTLMLEAGDRATSGDHMILRRDIVYDADSGPQTIGRLEFVATRQSVWERTRLRLFIATGIALLTVAMAIAATLFALQRIIASPLERLLSSINKARSGAGREQVDWHSADELGQVISAFNEMQLQQEAYEQELRERRETLEKRVAERTSALEQLSNQLAKYLSPQVYESIFRGKQEVKVTSSRKKLTVFFSDIADFTETADKLESEELTQLLNHYLTEMSHIALAHGATVDKYVGDAILIFFGDPETRGAKEDALACVRMAIAMRDKMQELQTLWRGSGIEKPLRCRMGIHTDYCTVGNFGSEDRLDYTIIGGGVNTASRLESSATPGEILISYETFAHVRDQIDCEEHGTLQVRGIAYPVVTYKVLDTFENLGRQRRRFREDHPNVKLDLDLEAMTSEDRDQAAEILRRALDVVSSEHESARPEQAKKAKSARQ